MAAIRYPVHLEVAQDGRCLAHVLDLPGCITRAQTRDEAMGQLPAAIRDYHTWLRSHGEPALAPDVPVELEVAGESTGFGPFDPGDAAALFAPDREPLAMRDMERLFRLLSWTRTDLLSLVRDLAGDLLDWQPHPQSFSIRRLLRHVGTAEQWYISRLVPPETLPAGWDDDEGLPIFTFLEMERRTALQRLRELTEADRSRLFYPTAWTRNPGEPWTARKVLRRALEHEREHTAQVRDILAARRRWHMARLAAERANLLQQLVGLDYHALATFPVLEGWAVEDLLAHIAAWDRWEHRTMRSMVEGRLPDLSALASFDATNAAFVAAWHERTAGLTPGEALTHVLDDLIIARVDWTAWLDELPGSEFFRRRSYDGYDWSFDAVPLRVQSNHDAAHARQVAAWRQARGLGSAAGPKSILMAALAAARDELLSAADLVPDGQAASYPICGRWTLKDVLGHIADWEWFGVEGLGRMVREQECEIEAVVDIDAWNRVHVQARRDQPWAAVRADVDAAREALLDLLGAMKEEDLARVFAFPWGSQGSAYEWIAVYLAHDREHAQGLRAELGQESTGEGS